MATVKHPCNSLDHETQLTPDVLFRDGMQGY